jgi:hypothetical protein
LLHTLAVKAMATAFSPDATLVAAGDKEGRIDVFAVADGKLLSSLRASRNRINCLALARDRRKTVPTGARAQASKPNPKKGWLMAAGDAGGTLTVWDVDAALPRSYCRGNHYDVVSVAFSPDGVTLASTCRGQSLSCRLWDLATGRPLLELKGAEFAVALAFSPDGRLLALGNVPNFNSPSQVCVFDLEFGRGIRTYRGLVSQVAKVCFSRDGRLLAAVAHDWQVGIWDVERGIGRRSRSCRGIGTAPRHHEPGIVCYCYGRRRHQPGRTDGLCRQPQANQRQRNGWHAHGRPSNRSRRGDQRQPGRPGRVDEKRHRHGDAVGQQGLQRRDGGLVRHVDCNQCRRFARRVELDRRELGSFAGGAAKAAAVAAVPASLPRMVKASEAVFSEVTVTSTGLHPLPGPKAPPQCEVYRRRAVFVAPRSQSTSGTFFPAKTPAIPYLPIL